MRRRQGLRQQRPTAMPSPTSLQPKALVTFWWQHLNRWHKLCREGGHFAQLQKTLAHTSLWGAILPGFPQNREAERAERLLRMDELGARKPTQLMSKILHLYGPKPHNFLLKHIFLRALPERLQDALATVQEEDLEKFAKEADRLAPLVERQSLLTNSAAVDAVRQRAAIQQPAQKSDWCFFHARFGAKARNCRAPCTWPKGNGPTGSQ